MSADTYADQQRREWYAEAEYVPDGPPEVVTVVGSNLRIVPAIGNMVHASLEAEAAVKGFNVTLSFADEASKAFEQLMNAVTGTYTELAKKFTAATKKSDYAQFPPPLEEETPRERALRLKKQPHSMAAPTRGWDHRGRRRY